MDYNDILLIINARIFLGGENATDVIIAEYKKGNLTQEQRNELINAF